VALQKRVGSLSFVLLDIYSGQITPLMAAGRRESAVRRPGPGDPALPDPLAIWSRDETHVQLVNVQPPGMGSSMSSAPIVVNYDLNRGSWDLGSWDGSAPSPPRGPSLGNLSVFVREAANQPAKLIASYDGGERVLLDANPAFSQIHITKVERLDWLDNGRPAAGRLLLPRSSAPGKLLPLVVQVESALGFDSFLPDGTTPSAFAAQVFSSQGFAVLEIPSIVEDRNMWGGEGPQFTGRLEAAIRAVSSKYAIDQSRIALVGHSRTGFQVFYAITHPRFFQFAAAVIIDSFPGSYTWHATAGALIPGYATDLSDANFEMMGGTFWDRKSEWLEHETTFNVDRVRTPALFALHGSEPDGSRGDVPSADVLGAFNLNHRPVEYLWLPTGSHALLRPRERQAEMQAAVDWMNFWLADLAPADAKRAASWEPLRKQQEKVLQTPILPHVKWVPIPLAN